MATPTPDSRWRLYTVDEAANLLGWSRATVYRLLKGRHPIPHRNIEGIGIQFHGDDLDAILTRAARGKR